MNIAAFNSFSGKPAGPSYVTQTVPYGYGKVRKNFGYPSFKKNRQYRVLASTMLFRQVGNATLPVESKGTYMQTYDPNQAVSFAVALIQKKIFDNVEIYSFPVESGTVLIKKRELYWKNGMYV